VIILIINKELIEDITQRIASSGITSGAIADVKKMLEIKEALLWRADAGTCCGAQLRGITFSLENEVNTLKNILSALEVNNTDQAIRLLTGYSDMIDPAQGDYEPGRCQPDG
jgi:phage tail sheath protein FI